MVSVLPPRIESPRQAPGQSLRQQPHFGSTGGAVSKIAYEGVSNKIAPVVLAMASTGFGKLGGLSFEDWAARLLTIFGIYIPQGLIAVKEDKHKWETNGRNALVWTMTLGLTMLVKNDKFSTNTLLNFFMKNREAASGEPKGFLGKMFHKMKLDGDYFDILKSAKIGFKEADRAKAHWSNLDKNAMDTIELHLQELLSKKTLTEAEQKLTKLIPKFVFRRNSFNVISTGIITLLTMYVIGKVAMELVFRFIAPLDHDFDPSRFKSGGKPVAPKQNRLPAIHQYPPTGGQRLYAAQSAQNGGRQQGQYPAYMQPQNGRH